MLRDIEPVATRSALHPSSTKYFQVIEGSIPEVEIVNRSLLVSHIDVEGKEVHRSQSLATENLEERREAISIEVWMWRRRIHHSIRHAELGRTEGFLCGKKIIVWDWIL